MATGLSMPPARKTSYTLMTPPINKITRNVGSGNQPFIENVDSFTFAYLDASGTVTADRSKMFVGSESRSPEEQPNPIRNIPPTGVIGPTP